MLKYVPDTLKESSRLMVFVDGENLAIRYGELIGVNEPDEHVTFERNEFVWSLYCNIPGRVVDTVRRYYYTCVSGDAPKLKTTEMRLKDLGIQAPRVFAKIKGTRRKQVDIALATDMLTHAHRDNFDAAILVAGDQDYVPLVDAVKAEGKRVVVWFLESGLSAELKQAADHYFDIGKILLTPKDELSYIHR
jgi:uncharacterized LabA/DUF88 family protein